MVKKVAVLGSGSWGTTASLCISENIEKLKKFDNTIKVWVFEEQYEGRNLSQIINDDHINSKYLSGVSLPKNIVAVPDIIEVVKDATHILFVIPHQFLNKVIAQIKDHVRSDAVGISLIKGFIEKDDKIILISNVISDSLGIHMSVLSGANIASEIALKKFSETTIGCDKKDLGAEWKSLFHTSFFKVDVVPIREPLEIFGALKNVVAVAAGFTDGLELGNNTKSAIMRIGMNEMIKYCQSCYENIDYKHFFESFGIADLITTCYGGRNRLVSAEVAKTGKSFEELEAQLLNGQKLQGPGTALHFYNHLKTLGCEHEYPLISTVYEIVYNGKKPEYLIDTLEKLL